MAIFKQTKAYEIEGLPICVEGNTKGYKTSQFLVERTGTSKTMKTPNGKTKLYINRV